MNISPLDLRQPQFRSALRGFDKIAVTSFLLAAADDYEQALRDMDRLRQEVLRLEAALSEHREHDKTLKTTLVAAQKLADDIRTNAEQQADRLIREARSRAELLLERTQARFDGAQRDIEVLKLKRREVETTIEGTIQALRHTLEYVRGQEAHEREDNILLHRPRQADAPSHERRTEEPGDERATEVTEFGEAAGR